MIIPIFFKKIINHLYTEKFISLSSMIISLISLFACIRINKLTKETIKNSKPNIDFNIQDSCYFRRDSYFMYYFILLITNQSDNANSIKEINLTVSHEEEKYIKKGTIFSPIQNDEIILSQQPSILPEFIEGRNSKLIHIYFKIPIEFKYSKKFLDYKLEICDSFDNLKVLSKSIINEVYN